MYNAELISTIKDKAVKFIAELQNDDTKREFKIEDIQVKDKEIVLGESKFTDEARQKLLNILKVKRDFPDYAQKLNSNDWEYIIEKLKLANKDSEWIAQISTNEKVQSIYRKKLTKRKDDNVSLEWGINTICEELGQCPITFELKGMSLNKELEKIDLVLLNQYDELDIFGNGEDKWKMGTNFTFNPFEFSVQPFFERLSCSNGMRSKELGFNGKISQKMFNTDNIQKHIAKAFDPNMEKHQELITMCVNHLRDNNISIREFYAFRKRFEKRAKEDKNYENLVFKFFNDAPFYKTYGENIAKKSPKWKATANTGINAYNFFNLLTWIASHREETKITETEMLDLQIDAGSLFFKKEFDLEDIAEVKEIKYDLPKEAN